jgi:zinc protease
VQREVRRGIEPKARTQLVFSGPFEYNAANRYLLQSLAEVLTISLRERLREDLGATYGVGVGASPSRIPRGEYTFTIDFGSSPERAEELVRAIFAYVDTLKRVGADTAAISKVRETQLRGRETALRQNGYWLSQIAFHDQTGEDPAAVLSIEPMVSQLTSAAIGDAARRWLNMSRYVRVTLLPEKRQ